MCIRDRDSRLIKKDCLFFALKGQNFDGNEFAIEALRKGAKFAIVDRSSIAKKNNRLILVEDSLKALQELAQYHRKQIATKIIALTGSNGKTTTKDFLHNVLSYYEPTFSAPESFNNELGITLSKAKLSNMDKYAIFEVGMNMKDEICHLSNLINPDIAIITNIGEAHIGNLGSKENIAIEKSNIIEGMSSGGVVLLPRDSDYFELLQKKVSGKKLRYITFGHSNKSDIQITEISRVKDRILLKFRIFGEIFQTSSDIQNISIFNNYLPVLGIANILNYDLDETLKNIENSRLHKSRWQEFDFEFDGGQIKLIDDSYNASPTSMFDAIESIDSYRGEQIFRKIIIIGDMLELGDLSDKYHSELVNRINRTNIDHVYFCGEYLTPVFSKLSPKKRKKQFKSIEYIHSIDNFKLKRGDLIFIKGSNKIGLNNLVQEFINYLALS